MVWPFSKKPVLTAEQADRCRRRCGMAAATYSHCLAANPGARSICDSLETQVVHCHAEVVCPALAEEHSRCFKRVVNSKGREPYSACSKEVEAMRKQLRLLGLYPFCSSPPASSSSSGGGGSSGGSRLHGGRSAG